MLLIHCPTNLSVTLQNGSISGTKNSLTTPFSLLPPETGSKSAESNNIFQMQVLRVVLPAAGGRAHERQGG